MHSHLDASHDSDAALHRIRTAGSISISPELFEKLYLSPETQRLCKFSFYVLSEVTNIGSALIGFLLSLHPLSMTLMGWRGAGGAGASSTGVSLH
jgi:hypothetical protein